MAQDQQELKSLLSQMDRVALTSLKPHPRNPRRGDVSAIAESLEHNQQYRPIVVQKSTGYVVAGNHTLLGARKLGWSHLDVVRIDITDKQARKIMLADNRTADLATYDDQLLAEIVQDLEGEIAGTGYDQEAVDSLLATVEEQFQSSTSETYLPESTGHDAYYLDPDDDEPASPRIPTRREEYLDSRTEEQEQASLRRGAPLTRHSTQEEVDRLRAQAELQASFEVLADQDLRGTDFWQIPDLCEDMLLEDIAPDSTAWGGKGILGAVPDVPGRWYFYNYGSGGMDDFPDWSRIVLAFSTYDEKFENWWDLPAYYLSRMVSSGIDKATIPDFSLYDEMPRVMHLNNVYRGQWMGRYFQECGVKVIPRFQFSDLDSLRFCTRGIPRGCPLLYITMHNFKRSDPNGEPLDREAGEQLVMDATKAGVDDIKPKKLLLYGSPKKLHRLAEDHLSELGIPIQVIPSYSDVRTRSGMFGARKNVVAEERKRLKESAKRSGPGEGSGLEGEDQDGEDQS